MALDERTLTDAAVERNVEVYGVDMILRVCCCALAQLIANLNYTKMCSVD